MFWRLRRANQVGLEHCKKHYLRGCHHTFTAATEWKYNSHATSHICLPLQQLNNYAVYSINSFAFLGKDYIPDYLITLFICDINLGIERKFNTGSSMTVWLKKCLCFVFIFVGGQAGIPHPCSRNIRLHHLLGLKAA